MSLLVERAPDAVRSSLADAQRAVRVVATRWADRRDLLDDQIAFNTALYGPRHRWPREAELTVRSMEDALTQIESRRQDAEQLVDDLAQMVNAHKPH